MKVVVASIVDVDDEQKSQGSLEVIAWFFKQIKCRATFPHTTTLGKKALVGNS